MLTKSGAFNLFEKNLTFVKVFGILFILIVALTNYKQTKYTGIIKTKSKEFSIESLMFALSTVFPFLILTFLRNNKLSGKVIFAICVILGIVFFVLNYLLEMTGLYGITFHGDEQHKKEEEKVKEHMGDNDNPKDEPANPLVENLKKSVSISSQLVVASAIVIPILIMLFTAFVVRDTNPDYVRFKSSPKLVVFIIETILFGALSAGPIFLMAKNRDSLTPETKKEFGLVLVKFALLHVLLQISGFYRHTFKKVEE